MDKEIVIVIDDVFAGKTKDYADLFNKHYSHNQNVTFEAHQGSYVNAGRNYSDHTHGGFVAQYALERVVHLTKKGYKIKMVLSQAPLTAVDPKTNKGVKTEKYDMLHNKVEGDTEEEKRINVENGSVQYRHTKTVLERYDPHLLIESYGAKAAVNESYSKIDNGLKYTDRMITKNGTIRFKAVRNDAVKAKGSFMSDATVDQNPYALKGDKTNTIIVDEIKNEVKASPDIAIQGTTGRQEATFLKFRRAEDNKLHATTVKSTRLGAASSWLNPQVAGTLTKICAEGVEQGVTGKKAGELVRACLASISESIQKRQTQTKKPESLTQSMDDALTLINKGLDASQKKAIIDQNLKAQRSKVTPAEAMNADINLDLNIPLNPTKGN